jgi:osmotically-inducible protein OsmY
MADRWMDERDRQWRAQDDFGRRAGGARGRGVEDRSFDRDRVFGERETGVEYNRASPPRPAADYRSRPDWQDRDYAGVSPAMQRGEYDSGYRANPRFQSQDYRGGGRHGGRFDSAPRDDEGQRFGSRDADERYARAARQAAPGGTGGYDYERGYGDGGREERFEERGREAGEFFHRAGQKLSSWFGDVRRDLGFEEHGGADEGYRSHRGRGPQGYKRPDERINDDAHQRLTDDPWLDASNINVSVAGGEVTLSGTVDSREAKHRAERLIEDLPGVNHVQNNLRLKARGDTAAGRGFRDDLNPPQTRHEDSGDPSTSATAASSTSASTRRN